MHTTKSRVSSLFIAITLLVTACGGASPESLIEAAGTATGADLDQVELNEDGTFNAQVGGADVAFGGDDRPEWLEPQFVLPADLNLQYAINDPSTGERAITGTVEGGDAAEIMQQQVASLTAAGYERIGDTGYFVAPGAKPIDLQVEQEGTTVYFSWEYSFEDEQTLRDAFAPIEGQGKMAITLGDDRLLFEGPCSLRSTSGQFATGDNVEFGQGSATVELRDGAQDYVLASVATINDEVIGSWTMLQQDEDGNYPQVGVDPRGFSISGFMTNFADGTTVPVVIGVTCPA